jgi:sugar lactone lactonase YvrE
LKRQGFISSVLVVLLSLALPGIASADYAHVGTFSGPGTEPGQLQTPGRGVVEQSTGNPFVVDSGNDRVQVFEPNGSGTADPLTSFGDGELSEPWGIAIAEDGGQTSVYVADAGNNRILKYDSDEAETPSFTIDAAFASPVAGSGSGEVGSFKAALAIDPTTGDLLLADNANKLIQRFEADGTFLTAFDGSNGSTAFAGPIDLAVNSGGDVYVIDANGDIANAQGTSKALRYSGSGEFKAELAPVGERERPAAVAVNTDNDEVVVSGNQDNVYELGPPPFVPILQRFDAANQPLSSPAVDVGATYDTVSGLAFAGTAKRLYVVMDYGYWMGSPYGAPQIQVLKELSNPVVALEPVEAETITGDGALIEGSVNPNGLTAQWRLEYRRAGAETWTGTGVEDAGDGIEPVPFSVQLSGLLPNTEYETRIVASNSDGEAISPVQAFTTVSGPPAASVTFASSVGTASAWLNGGVNPSGEPTTYRFEYGTKPCDANPCLAVPPGSPQEAGGGTATKQIAVRLGGLQAATTYHFRVVAENALGSHASAEQTFTTLAAGDAPHGWELVSPARKGGGEVAFDAGFLGGGGALAPDGSRVAFVSRSTLVGDTGAPMASTYVATRGDRAWDSRNVTPPLASAPNLNSPQQAPVRPLSEDLTKGVVQTNVDPLTHQRTGRKNLYFRDFATDEYRLLTPDALGGPPQYTIESVQLSVFDWTPSLGHIVFVSTAELTPDSVGVDGRKAYVIPTATGEPVLASVLASGDGSAIGGTLLGGGHHNENVLSDDGSKLFFETDAGLHLRDLEIGGTLDLPGRFADATGDGRYVMVGSTAQLVAADTDDQEDLYRIDTESPGADPILISADEEPVDGEEGALVANLAVTPDGARAYFVMEGSQLVSGAPRGGEKEIYLWDEEEGLSFVGGFESVAEPFLDYSARGAAVDVNASGDTLVVHSRANMTPPQEAGRLPGEIFTEQQVYVYERRRSTPAEPSLVCVSCLPGPGPTDFRTRLSSDKGEGMFRNSARKFVTSDGTVVFQTAAPLVPTDTNGANFDVYRYREGDLELVSPGRQPYNAYLFGASPSGAIAFATVERLTPWDVDNSTDAYVSRAGAGFADPPPVPAPRLGEDCRGPALPPPPASVPGTSVLSGPGNPRPARPKARCKRRSKAAKGPRSARAAKKAKCRSVKPKKANKRGEK